MTSTDCHNCDCQCNSSYYTCYHSKCIQLHGDNKQHFINLCSFCTIELHKNHKKNQRHKIQFNNHIGFGLCQNCIKNYKNNNHDGTDEKNPINLSLLYCEACSINLCYDCDYLLHLHVENHIRIELDEESENIDSRSNISVTNSAQLNKYKFHIVCSNEEMCISLYNMKSLSNYAGIVWEGSILLSNYINYALINKKLQYSAHVRVIELGSGCAALPSLNTLLQAKEEISIIATDINQQAINLLDININTFKASLAERNIAISANLYTELLAFGDLDKAATIVRQYCSNGEGFHVILGSFILYDQDVFQALSNSLFTLINNGRRVHLILASQERLREPQFFKCFNSKVQQFNYTANITRAVLNNGDWNEEMLDADAIPASTSRVVSILHIQLQHK
jgi:predicted nicotinamide N-methyase